VNTVVWSFAATTTCVNMQPSGSVKCQCAVASCDVRSHRPVVPVMGLRSP
jgi:hypothetical protein